MRQCVLTSIKSHVRVGCVLDFCVGQAIANGKAFQGNFEVVAVFLVLLPNVV